MYILVDESRSKRVDEIERRNFSDWKFVTVPLRFRDSQEDSEYRFLLIGFVEYEEPNRAAKWGR